eukprot:gene2421-3132_t
MEEIEEYEEETMPLKKQHPDDNYDHHYKFMFKTRLICTKKIQSTVRFELMNGVELDSKVSTYLSGNSSNLHFKVSDFVNKRALLSYKNEKPAEFEVSGLDLHSSTSIAYLKGLLARKNEVAVLPVPDTSFQILLFEKEESESFEPILSALLVQKYNLILDLDETLIRTRIVIDSSERNHPNEFYFEVENYRYFCSVRPGTAELLQWACQIFNVHIFTNSVFDYAKNVLKILDPKKEHLLKNISNEKDLANLLKSRENFKKLSANSKIGIKNLSQFSLDVFQSVILDDDINVWIEKDNWKGVLFDS